MMHHSPPISQRMSFAPWRSSIWLSLCHPAGTGRVHQLVIYCKLISEKSVSDSEYLIYSFKIKLIKMNVNNPKVVSNLY